MKKLLVLFLLLVLALPVFAQIELVEDLLFQEVPMVIGVSKAKQDSRYVPMSVYVIDKDEMERWGNSLSLYEILGRVPGFSFYDTDFYGQVGVLGRGLPLVWRYGFGIKLMPIVDFGHMIFPTSFFKNIETARGPAGLSWGNMAEGGLINCNVRDDLEGVETRVGFGSNSRRAYDILYGSKLNDAGDNVFIGWHSEEQKFNSRTTERGVDYKENGINPSFSVLGKIKYKQMKVLAYKDHNEHILSKDRISLTAVTRILFESKNGTPHDELETTALRGEYYLIDDPQVTSFYFYADYYSKQWYRTGIGLDTQRRNSVGFSAEKYLMDQRLHFNLGGDLWTRDTTTDPSYNSSFFIANGSNDWYANGYYPVKKESRNFYLQSDYKISDKFTVLLGARADWELNAQDEWIFSGPRLGFFFTPTETLVVKYIYNDNIRRARGNEVSSQTGIIDPNPERINVHELCLNYNIAEKASASVTLFQQKLEDQIVRRDAVGLERPGDSQNYWNAGGMDVAGLEWALKFTPVKNLLAYWNATYLNAEIKRAIVRGVDVSSPHLTDWRSPYVPQYSGIVGCEYDVAKTVKIAVDIRTYYKIAYIDAVGSDADTSVSLVDLTLRTKKFRNNFSFNLGVKNLLDEDKEVPNFGEHSWFSRKILVGSRRYVFQAVCVF